MKKAKKIQAVTGKETKEANEDKETMAKEV